MSDKLRAGIQIAVLVALIGIAVSERAHVLRQVEHNTLRIALNEELLRSFQDYPRSATDFRVIVMSGVRDVLNPKLEELDKRLNALERKVDRLNHAAP